MALQAVHHQMLNLALSRAGGEVGEVQFCRTGLCKVREYI